MKKLSFFITSFILILCFSCENPLENKDSPALITSLNEKNLKVSDSKLAFEDSLELFDFIEKIKLKSNFDSLKKSLESPKFKSLYDYYKGLKDGDYEEMISKKSFLTNYRFQTSKGPKASLINYSIPDRYLQILLNENSEVLVNNQNYRFTHEFVEIYDKNNKFLSKVKNKFHNGKYSTSKKAKVLNKNQDNFYSHNNRNYLAEFSSNAYGVNYDNSGQIHYGTYLVEFCHRKSFLGWYYLHDSDLMEININYTRSYYISGTSTCGNSPQYGQGFGLYLPYTSNGYINLEQNSGSPCHANINVYGFIKGKNNQFYYFNDSN